MSLSPGLVVVVFLVAVIIDLKKISSPASRMMDSLSKQLGKDDLRPEMPID